MAQPILEARNLVKKFGSVTAVNDLSFSIEEGEVFGLLGPNGAGKSTTISMLTGLFPPDSGSIRIVGCDAVTEIDKIRPLIGVVPQELALYPALSARENLYFFGEIYGLTGTRLRERVYNVLEIVGMTGRANDPVETYSGGMKRRTNLAIGLVHNPRLLFLDEPTTGVDPQSRNHIFESIERLNREEGMSILYTTHYMEEAERLCDRVAIIDGGKIIALDTPRNLIAMLGGGIIQIGLRRKDEALCKQVQGLSQVQSASLLPVNAGAAAVNASASPDTAASDETSASLEAGDSTESAPDAAEAAATASGGCAGDDDHEASGRWVLKVQANHVNEALLQIIQLFNQNQIEILSLETLEPNLESVFLHLTGKSLRDS
ncbi:MAG: ABC transporter ATP-binding protein [Chloroflexi bacterium]|nr:ABC transporter ATP-binding protein [Chloroflexota bacterium]